MTDRVIVQRLTQYLWLARSRSLDDQTTAIAHILYALKLSIRRLGEYYQDLTKISLPEGQLLYSRFFPSIDSYRHPLTNQEVQFRYVKALEPDPTCVTFLVTQDGNEPEEVVLKFVTCYGVEAHKHMAERGLAPKLIYHGSIGDGAGYGNLRMVIMEYVQGETLSVGYGKGALPEEVRESVKAALMALRDGGFVYGDLRRPNVMLTDEDGPMKSRIRFIDFDWSGKLGDVIYPPHLSCYIKETSGADDGDVIQRKHEDGMLERL